MLILLETCRRKWVLDKSSASLYFLDIIGSGFSAKPNIEYTLTGHLQYLHTFIKNNVHEKTILLVGHSTGAIIALGYTAKYPESIKKTFLISLPYYNTPQEAKYFARQSQTFKYYATDSLWTHLTCLTICTLFGPITRQIAPLFYRNAPRAVVQDYFRHSYNSYMKTLTNIVYNQNIPSLITTQSKNKLILVHGAEDKTAPLSHVQELSKNYQIPLHIQHGTHRLPLHKNSHITGLLEKTI